MSAGIDASAIAIANQTTKKSAECDDRLVVV
jgi:hypothetical protein